MRDWSLSVGDDVRDRSRPWGLPRHRSHHGLASGRPVALVDPLGAHGGLHYYVDGQARALREHGVAPIVFTRPYGRDRAQPYVVVPSFEGVYGSATKVRRGVRLGVGLARAALSARLAGASTCIYHVFKADLFEAWAVATCRLLGMRAVAVVHDVERLDRPRRFDWLNLIARMSSRLVVHNAYSRRALERALGSAYRDAAVIPHGSYVDQFPSPPDQAVARDRLGLPQEARILLFFGNPRRSKGLAVLLEAMTIHRERQDLLLVVAGKMSSADERHYRSLVARTGLAPLVRMDVGHVPDAELANYYCAADLVVVPYTKVYESGVALMAMTLGRTVLASDLEPLVELLAGGERGLLFTTGDAGALAAQIEHALDGQAGELEAIGQRAASYARVERSWSQSGALWAELITQL